MFLDQDELEAAMAAYRPQPKRKGLSWDTKFMVYCALFVGAYVACQNGMVLLAVLGIGGLWLLNKAFNTLTDSIRDDIKGLIGR